MEKVKELLLKLLPPNSKNALPVIMGRLEEKGVEDVDDLQLIDFETDMKDVLKDIQARKLKLNYEKYINQIQEHDGNISCLTPAVPSADPGPSSLVENEAATTSTISSILAQNKLWAENFVVPNDLFSKVITSKLEKGHRPHPAELREMVRVIISKVMDLCEKPIKQQLIQVASKIVAKYPALRDEVNGSLIGTGSDGLLRKMIARVENVSRPTMKRKLKVSIKQQYGCKNFLPEEDQNSLTILNNYKEEMKGIYLHIEWNGNLIADLMNKSFPLQRKCIVEEKYSIPKLKEEFPFLFISTYFKGHFEKLMEIDLKEKQELQVIQMQELITFFKSKNITLAADQFLEGLVTYFNEDLTAVMRIFKAEDSTTQMENIESTPLSPYIAAFGDPYTMGKNCVLYIDRKAASEFVDLNEATTLWFSSFYIFGLVYPESCPATAEFIQRVFYGINPKKGCKTKKRNRSVNINSKVSRLVEALCNFKSIWKM